MYADVLKFWFEELEPKQWWVKDEELDRLIVDRFSGLHGQATRCELYPWRETVQGRLAEIIILDQLSRNMFRGSPLSFAFDSLALALAQEAVSIGADRQLTQIERNFLYMPYMHCSCLRVMALRVVTNMKSDIEILLRRSVDIPTGTLSLAESPLRRKSSSSNSPDQDFDSKIYAVGCCSNEFRRVNLQAGAI